MMKPRLVSGHEYWRVYPNGNSVEVMAEVGQHLWLEHEGARPLSVYLSRKGGKLCWEITDLVNETELWI